MRRGLATIGILAALAVLAAAPAPAKTLVLAATGTPEGFDGDALRPNTQPVFIQVYEAMLRYARKKDANGNEALDSTSFDGNFAESWTVSDDGKRIAMKLRQGVRSFRGNELTSADIVWTYEKQMAQRRTGRFLHSVANIAGVEATGKHEVTYVLNAPSAVFFSVMTHYIYGPYDSTEMKKHATAEDPWSLKWIESNTAGFGPYHLESLRPGEQAVFIANPNYHRGRPEFDRVVYRAVPSGANRASLLKTGQVQWVEEMTVAQIRDLQQDRRVKVMQSIGTRHAAVKMNPKFKPFDDVRVRQAVNHALDQKTLNEAVFFGAGTLARTPVPPIVEGTAPEFFPFTHDVAKAKQLLAEAGYPSGVDVELLYSNLQPWEEPMAIQVAEQLKAADIRVSLKRIPGSELTARSTVARMDMPFFTYEDGPTVLDPVFAMTIFARSNGVSNRANYANPKVDELIDTAGRTLDRAKRIELVREIQRIWINEAPWALIAYPPVYESMTPDISGWVYHPDFHERWFDLKSSK